MDETKGFTKLCRKDADIEDQLELCKKLLARLTSENVGGIILTIAEHPKVEDLTPEQLAEIKAHGLEPDQATRVSHVLVGGIEALVHLFKATGHCIYETHKAVITPPETQPKGRGDFEDLERTDGTVLH